MTQTASDLLGQDRRVPHEGIYLHKCKIVNSVPTVPLSCPTFETVPYLRKRHWDSEWDKKPVPHPL